jgi:hypothetical protein
LSLSKESQFLKNTLHGHPFFKQIRLRSLEESHGLREWLQPLQHRHP